MAKDYIVLEKIYFNKMRREISCGGSRWRRKVWKDRFLTLTGGYHEGKYVMMNYVTMSLSETTMSMVNYDKDKPKVNDFLWNQWNALIITDDCRFSYFGERLVICLNVA